MRELIVIIAMFMGVGGTVLGMDVPEPVAIYGNTGCAELQPQTMSMEVTAYCYTGSKTASGTWPKAGTVAADTSVLPFGTKVYIPGYGIGTVEDRGGEIRGARLDVYLPTRAAAIEWGRKKNVEVTIVEWGEVDAKV